MADSILGPHADRVKTDVRLPKKLVKQVEALCEELGVPKNAFFTLAAGFLVVQLAPLLRANKGQKTVAVIEDLFQTVLKRYRNH